ASHSESHLTSRSQVFRNAEDVMNALFFLLFLAFGCLSISGSGKTPNAAIDKRFKLSHFAKLKRTLRRSGPQELEYALPRPPLARVHEGDYSGEQTVRSASQEQRRGVRPVHRTASSERKAKVVKSGRAFGASHRKEVTRTTTAIPSTSRPYRRSTPVRPAWSQVPYVIASSSGESKQTPYGYSRSSGKNDIVEKHSGFHTMGEGTTAFRRKILRMIVEQSLSRLLSRKADNSRRVSPEVVHVSGVYTDPNDNPPTSTPALRRKLLPGYPRSSSHENNLIVDVPRSSSREDSDEAFQPVFQVQPATRIHEDSSEFLTSPLPTTLKRVVIQRPTTMIIHRKPPHAPPVFLRPTEIPPLETTTELPREDDMEDIETTEAESNNIEEDEGYVTLSPYARSKLLRYAHRQRKRRVRQDDSIPAKFQQESLACRYCYVYWKRQDIQPRDIFNFCCRFKNRA
ncbi:hypothetical protein PMAYCL1PPCAC_03246, partial [Pristionchus mayeri]